MGFDPYSQFTTCEMCVRLDICGHCLYVMSNTQNGDTCMSMLGCYCCTHLFVEDAVHEEYHNTLQGDKHKEDPLYYLNVRWVIPKDQKSRDPTESKHRIQNDSCSK